MLLGVESSRTAASRVAGWWLVLIETRQQHRSHYNQERSRPNAKKPDPTRIMNERTLATCGGRVERAVTVRTESLQIKTVGLTFCSADAMRAAASEMWKFYALQFISPFRLSLGLQCCSARVPTRTVAAGGLCRLPEPPPSRPTTIGAHHFHHRKNKQMVDYQPAALFRGA